MSRLASVPLDAESGTIEREPDHGDVFVDRVTKERFCIRNVVFSETLMAVTYIEDGYYPPKTAHIQIFDFL
jgi:hypothetical protein